MRPRLQDRRRRLAIHAMFGLLVAGAARVEAQQGTPPVMAPPTSLPAPPHAAHRDSRALSLAEAVALAQGRSVTVRIASAGVDRAAGELLQARSQLLPQLSGSGNFTRTLRSQYEGLFSGSSAADTTKPKAPAGPCDKYLRDASATTDERLAGFELAARCAAGQNLFSSFSSLPFGQKNAYTFGLTLTQSVYSGGRIGAQNDVAQAGKKTAELDVDAQRAQLTLDIARAYYDASLAGQLVAIAESSYVQAENTLRQVEASKNVGNVSEFELLRARVTVDNQKPVVIQRVSDRDVALLRLKQLLDLPLETDLALTTSISDTTALPPGVTVTAWQSPDTVTVDRVSVREAAQAVMVQEGLLRVARGDRLPSVNLISQYSKVGYPRGTFPSWNDLRDNWTVGVSAQVPFFTGGRLRGEEMVARANVAEAQARLEQTRQYAALDTRVALSDLQQAQAAWTASAGTVEQAQRAYGIAEVRYREGLSTQLELSDSRLLLQQALANRAMAARNLQIARIHVALLPRLPLAGAASTGAAQSTTPQSQPQMQQQQQQQQIQQGAGAGQGQMGGGVQ